MFFILEEVKNYALDSLQRPVRVLSIHFYLT